MLDIAQLPFQVPGFIHARQFLVKAELVNELLDLQAARIPVQSLAVQHERFVKSNLVVHGEVEGLPGTDHENC